MAINPIRYRAVLTYAETFSANNLTVKYDDTTYEVLKDSYGGYGDRNLKLNGTSSLFPFYIEHDGNNNVVWTSQSGEHTIEITKGGESIETTECFKKAVQSVSSMMLTYDPISNTINGATWQEAYDALQNGVMMFLRYGGTVYPISAYTPNDNINFGLTAVDRNQVISEFVIWSPDGTATVRTEVYPPQ